MTQLVPHPTIERLRTKAATALAELEAEKPSNTQIVSVVESLARCEDLETTSKKAGISESKVIDIIAELGTWLTHSNKSAPKAIIKAANESDTLFLGPWSHTLIQTKKRRGRPKKNYVPVTTPSVMIPEGFEPKGFHRRDVSKALAAIVVSPPDPNVLSRFLARTYSTRSSSLNYSVVSGVWYFAHAERLDHVDKVNKSDPVFHLQVVSAYDLLDVARQDAVDAIDKIVEGDTSDLDSLMDACLGAKWIAEREINKIEGMIEVARKRPAAIKALETELKYFAARANSSASYRPATIADLNVGQIQRISEAAGIPVEGSSRAEETDIRAKLKALGLSKDVDMLVPEGLRAAQVGQLDAFWDIMNARSEGDSTWSESLQELFA